MEMKSQQLSNDELLKKLAKSTLFVMDVDGTMTNGALSYQEESFGPTCFYVQDGVGIQLLHKYGIQTSIMTAGKSSIVKKRGKHLKIPHLFLGVDNKKAQLIALTQEMGISLEEVAYIGDDINDAAAMSISGVSFCPSDAHPSICDLVDCIIPIPGGRGAVRFACDLILKAKGHLLSIEEWK